MFIERERWQQVQAGWDLLRAIENDYECGGFCYDPLFYLTRDIENGRPDNECMTEIVGAITERVNVLCYATGGVLLLTFVCSLCLCGGIPEPEEE